MKEPARVHLTIKGRVQGVSYRAYTVETANKLGLKGWVKNTPDGGVEAVAEGEKGALEKLAEWCKEGPQLANVKSVLVNWEPFVGEFDDFDIAY
ncbi:MAG: acylphosphatase [Nitrospinae bacterium]|nr:acylphosphatase [Nitrospinota bacterium]